MRLARVLYAALALSFATATVPALSPAAYAETSIATVDLQEAINQVKDGIAAKGRLEGMFAEKQKSIAELEQRLMAMDEDYQKQAMVLSDAARQQKEQEMMQLQAQYQQLYMSSQQEMQQAYAEVMEGLIAKMRVICEDIGKERGYTMVVDVTEGGVVYTSDSIDITPELVKRYDAKHGG